MGIFTWLKKAAAAPPRQATAEPLQQAIKRLRVTVRQELSKKNGSVDRAARLNEEGNRLEGIMVDRNVEDRRLEKEGKAHHAARLYEANISDGFDGSHPYERLMRIYLGSSRVGDAVRVMSAWLANKHQGTDERMEKLCERVRNAVQQCQP